LVRQAAASPRFCAPSTASTNSNPHQHAEGSIAFALARIFSTIKDLNLLRARIGGMAVSEAHAFSDVDL